MKTFKNIISEVAEPKGGDEKRFKAKHVIAKYDHPIEDGAEENQFKGGTNKDRTKKASYEKGKDAEVYESMHDSKGMKKKKKKTYKEMFSGQDLAEDPFEEIPMMMRQLEFICYAAEEIKEYAEMTDDPEEWFQNKLAHVHGQMQGLHAYIEGDKRMMSAKMSDMNPMGEEVELDEAKKKTLIGSRDQFKSRDTADDEGKEQMRKLGGTSYTVHQSSNGLWGYKVFEEEVKLEEAAMTSAHKKIARDVHSQLESGEQMSPAAGAKVKSSLNMLRRKYGNDWKKKAGIQESTDLDEGAKNYFVYQKGVPKTKEVTHRGTEQSSKDWIKKNAKHYGHKGKDFVIYKGKYPNVKPSDALDFKYVAEEVELDEAFKMGSMKLDDGSTVKLSKEDAEAVNELFNELNSSNKKRMEEEMMKNKSGFDKVLKFAKEAM